MARIDTKVELYKDGSKRIFHRTKSGRTAWVHEYNDECAYCNDKKGEPRLSPTRHE